MSRQPVHVVRFGLIKACVWQNRRSTGDKYSITVVRLFKNGNTWKESTRFGRDDLPVIRLALDDVHSWVLEKTQERRSNQADDAASTSSRVSQATYDGRR